MIFTRLFIPRWLREQIVPYTKEPPARRMIIGGDTETVDGVPITLQFYSKHVKRADILWVDSETVLDTFLDWCFTLPTKVECVIYMHNLAFDAVSILWPIRKRLVEDSNGEFRVERKGWTIAGVYGSPTYFMLVDANRTRCVRVVDSSSYYRASLAKAAEIFCPHLPKIDAPEGLGVRRFEKGDSAFEAYAMRDAEIAFYLGCAIEKLHQEFRLSQTVSVADMAARIFRQHYMTNPIVQPSRAIVEASVLAYHGGKNNVSVPAGLYQNVRSLDISSAYPHAMQSLPAFTDERLYKRYRSQRVVNVPDLGVYCVDGRASPCRWPALFDHGFKALRGRFERVWISGHELNEALRAEELAIDRVSGYYYDSENDLYPSPFAAFVDGFYKRKSEATDKGMRTFYKLILNSLSGKFIQTRKANKCIFVDGDKLTVAPAGELQAGGLFHPFIAQAITSHTRARIHALEHQFEALHTATDGIFTQHSVSLSGDGVGSLTCEAQGDLLLLRNKLYVLYSDSGYVPSQLFPDKKIAKYALHGFAGNVHDLEQLIVSGRSQYNAKRVNKLRDSVRRGMQPNAFSTRTFKLNVNLAQLDLFASGGDTLPPKTANC